jgi:hypothetical protein
MHPSTAQQVKAALNRILAQKNGLPHGDAARISATHFDDGRCSFSLPIVRASKP